METPIYMAFVLAAFIIVAWTLDYDDEQEELNNPYDGEDEWKYKSENQ